MADQTEQVPVLRCVVSAFVFLRRNILFLYIVGSLYIFVDLVTAWFSFYFSAGSTLNTISVLLSFALLPLMVMVYAAYLRRGLGLAAKGVFGLQLGADELRLFLTFFAVTAITLFIVFLGALAGIFALSAVIAGVVDPAIIEAEPTSAFAHSGLIGLIAGFMVACGIIALGIYTSARFAPAFAAVIAEGRIVVFEAALWSKGQGWRMAAALILTTLPFYLILAPSLVQYFMLAFDGFSGVAGDEGARPAPLNMHTFLWFFVPVAVLWPAFNGALSGLYVTFYRGLRANREQ